MNGQAQESRLRREWRQLIALQASDRPWQMPFCAAMAAGLPLFVGAWFGHLDYGLVSSLGGMVFLYLPRTPVWHRMVTLMACSFAMTGCYALGAMSHFLPFSLVPVLALIATLIVMVCRFYAVAPPGAVFFLMAAAIGAFTPMEVEQLPLRVGLIALGCLLACLIALVYSLYVLGRGIRHAQPVAPLPKPDFDHVVVGSLIIGLSVGASLLAATLLQLDRPYWVPMSCLAVIQGASMRAVWTRQLHRVVGTFAGIGLAWMLLRLPLDPWRIAWLVLALTFIVETLVVRHYGLAVVFITPITLLLADATVLNPGAVDTTLQARVLDTLLGSFTGWLGGMCLHHRPLVAALGERLRRGRPATD
jgi:Fusaric acid resistance protein-like